jgi:AraC-like DNA-binding protein
VQRGSIREWREDYARGAVNVDFKPLSDAPFRASIQPVFDDLRIVRTTFSPGLTFRDDRSVKDAVDAFAFLIAQSRNIEVVHGQRTLRLAQADATLLSVCTPGSVGSAQEFCYLRVLIPGAELTMRVAHPDDLVAQCVPRRSDISQLLRAYIGSLVRGSLATSAYAGMTIRAHIIDLVALALTAQGVVGESGSPAVSAARLNAALACIAARFDEPELSISAVAEAQGISPRYLQRLIESTGITFTAHVNELRLQRAFSLLTESHDSVARISEIALRAGFSDISHFNRLFRSRFGDTPKGVRAQAHGS